MSRKNLDLLGHAADRTRLDPKGALGAPLRSMRCLAPPLRTLLLLALLAGCSTSVTLPSQPTNDAVGSDVLVSEDGANNTPPGPLTIRLTPETPGTQDPLVVMIEEEAVDPDNGPQPLEVRVRWYRDDQQVPASGLELQPALTSRSEIWSVEVVAFDGLAEGPVATAEVEIRNTAPVLHDVSIAPAEADVNTVLVCEAGARNDVDGDAVSIHYAWTLNDELIDSEEQNVLSPPLVAGGRYRCGGAPFDGANEGEAVWSAERLVEQTLVISAMISIAPKSLDLGIVLPLEISTLPFEVFNIGDGELVISAASLSGEAGFAYEFAVPQTILPGGSVAGIASFETQDPGLKKGTIHFETNAANPISAQLPLLGVGAAPCLIVQPSTVDFGGAYVLSHHDHPITLMSCGVIAVTVDSMVLLADGDSPFSLDLSKGPGPLPWTLEPGEQVEISAGFDPIAPSPVDVGGNPIQETATVSIQTTGVGPVMQVPITGFAGEAGCPTPVIDVAEGHFVSPGTVLHLDASGSIAPDGDVSYVSWAVTSPPGVASESFEPGTESESVSYPVNGLGEYVFSLKVFDEVDGAVLSGCGTATWSVTVKDAIPLIVELTWDTPGDSNQSDTGTGAGADLDLHAHDGQGDGPDYDGNGAPDTWFDFTHDVYWVDTSPDWGVAGPSDDPWLVIEDPDGQGPERLEYHAPLLDSVITLGAHVWSDYGFGASVATVRIYHFEELVHEISDVVIGTGDLWEAGAITWPKMTWLPSVGNDGGPRVTPAYPNPFQ